ncbi:MAG: glycosyltransferase family 4 protein [Chloroflexota bacterium]
MKDVLLTVSGTIPSDIREQVAAGKRPLPDYLHMADEYQADLLDYPTARHATGWFGRLLERLGGPNLMLAWACYQRRHDYRVILTDGEQVGIPLAMLFKFLGEANRPSHQMLVHILSVGKKMKFFDWFGIQDQIDLFFVYATWQKQFIQQRWHVPPQRVVLTPFMVDDDFFAPHQISDVSQAIRSLPKPYICSVGLEFRDYPTLMAAVKGLDVHVVVAAGSPWSKREDSTQQAEIPANVTVSRFSQYELRQIYADAAFVVMPLYDVAFQAGVTAILEGMAMGKAIVCSHTQGQTDVIVEGENGLYATPEDPADLRRAILELLNDPEEAARMGRNGRSLIETEMNLHHYVHRLKAHVQPEEYFLEIG